MSARKKKTNIHTVLAAWALVALLGLPAYAGRRSSTRDDSKTPSTDTSTSTSTSTTTYTSTTTSSSTTTTSSPTASFSTGDINPSSVALVDSDFVLSVASKVIELADPIVRDQVQAKEANQIARGNGVIVAVLDAGFTRYCDLLDDRMSDMGYDFVDRDSDPYDDSTAAEKISLAPASVVAQAPGRAWGHGTMVASMVLNAAPRATILPLRVRDRDGYGSDEAIVDAIYYAMKAGARVINLSISQDIMDGTYIKKAVMEARSYGIVVVASAGNDGLPFIPMDAIDEADLVVGAVDASDALADFSNWTWYEGYGSGRMVFAPGADVEGPMVVDGIPLRCAWSGTSFSAGLVSGAVALARELNPKLDPEDLADLVAGSTDPVQGPYKYVKVTGGRVNLLKLVTK